MRAGCDIAPVDPATDEGRLALLSYVWPDQADRLSRLRGALDVAREIPATVERAGAAEWLARARLERGTATVVWHSVMWQYVATDEKRAIEHRLAELGAQATVDTPLVHAALEPRQTDPRTIVVTLRQWPQLPERVEVAVAQPHGAPVDWVARRDQRS